MKNTDSPEHRRQQAAATRAAGGTLRAAGEAAGVAHTTVRRWEMDEGFRQRVGLAREQLLAELVGVAAEAWGQVRAHMAAGAYTPFEVAKVAGIATTNFARVSAAMPLPTAAEVADAPLTDAELAQVARMVSGW